MLAPLTRRQEAASPAEAMEALAALGPVAPLYPGFDAWWWSKVVPGVSAGTRKVSLERRGGRVVAVCVSKREDGESKVCTLWVDPEWTGRGIGVRLLREAMDWLGTDRPLVTVPAERMPAFEGLFDSLGFVRTATVPGLYRDGAEEHVFNGPRD